MFRSKLGISAAVVVGSLVVGFQTRHLSFFPSLSIHILVAAVVTLVWAYLDRWANNG